MKLASIVKDIIKESKVDDYVDEINDILSSGQDGEFSKWHQKELKTLYNKIPDILKDKFWKNYIISCKKIGPLEGELEFMSKLFNKPKPNIPVRDEYDDDDDDF